MNPEIVIRRIDPSEYSLLRNFLYEAIFVPEGTEPPDREIVNLKELAIYYKNFGTEHDACLLAEYQEKVIGAVWTRLFTKSDAGYGFLDDKTPELSMAVLKDYRKKGIGKQLLGSMLKLLIALGYKQVSLSVDLKNYAFRMYLKAGFTIFKSDSKSAIMVKKLEV